MMEFQAILVALYIVSAFLSVSQNLIVGDSLFFIFFLFLILLPPVFPVTRSAFSLKFSVREIRIDFGQREG